MLDVLLHFLIYPGLVFTAIIGWFFEWIARKLTARFQNRVGPPIYQPFIDFIKLISKDMLIPSASGRTMFIMMPMVAFASVLVLTMLIPIISSEPIFGFVGDVIVIMYLLIMIGIATMLCGSSSANPFGGVGASREMLLLISFELPLIISILTVVIEADSLEMREIITSQAGGVFALTAPLALVAFFLAMQAELGMLPFDQAEAETEIVDGVFVEYSGGLLGINRLTHDMKLFVMTSLCVALFFGGPVSWFGMPCIVGHLIKCIILLAVVALIATVTARVRIAQAFKFFWVIVTPIALVNLIWVIIRTVIA
jgi:NADH-quinone oxidoreductase subunit H